MKNTFTTCLTTLLIIILTTILVVFASLGGYFILVEATANNTRNSVTKSSSCHEEIYYDSDLSPDEVEHTKTALSMLPNYIQNILKEDWTILVAKDCIRKVDDIAAGATFYNERLIWIGLSKDTRVSLHEFGHAVDDILGLVSSSQEWRELYYQYNNVYIEEGCNTIIYHDISTNSEFFAAMFAEYYRNSEHLQTHAPEIYSYFNTLLEDPTQFSSSHLFLNRIVKCFRAINSSLPSLRVGSSSSEMMGKISNNIKHNDCINVDQYVPVVDYSWMSVDCQKVIKTIFLMLESPDDYQTTITPGTLISDGYIMEFDYPWTQEQYLELLSFLCLYFGDESLDPIDVNVINHARTRVILKKDIIVAAEKKRLDSLALVEQVLGQLKQGTEQEILIQVAHYIVSNSSYKLEAKSSFDSFWKNQSGDCVMYAMLLHQFANRIGVKSSIVTINMHNQNHIYNQIVFNDGTVFYYDLSKDIVHSRQIDKNNFVLHRWYS